MKLESDIKIAALMREALSAGNSVNIIIGSFHAGDNTETSLSKSFEELTGVEPENPKLDVSNIRIPHVNSVECATLLEERLLTVLTAAIGMTPSPVFPNLIKGIFAASAEECKSVSGIARKLNIARTSVIYHLKKHNIRVGEGGVKWT